MNVPVAGCGSCFGRSLHPARAAGHVTHPARLRTDFLHSRVEGGANGGNVGGRGGRDAAVDHVRAVEHAVGTDVLCGLVKNCEHPARTACSTQVSSLAPRAGSGPEGALAHRAECRQAPDRISRTVTQAARPQAYHPTPFPPPCGPLPAASVCGRRARGACPGTQLVAGRGENAREHSFQRRRPPSAGSCEQTSAPVRPGAPAAPPVSSTSWHCSSPPHPAAEAESASRGSTLVARRADIAPTTRVHTHTHTPYAARRALRARVCTRRAPASGAGMLHAWLAFLSISGPGLERMV
jgi:hypothetical protein